MDARYVAALCGVVGLAIAVPARAASGQIELDRVVARVDNRIITQADVRQARAIGLVDRTSSDQDTLRALENRLLMLGEIARSAPLPPTTDDQFGRVRAAWEARVGGTARAAALLDTEMMSENALEAWLRDDLRIEAHLGRQFGGVPEPDRQRVIAEWTARLRQRAGLR